VLVRQDYQWGKKKESKEGWVLKIQGGKVPDVGELHIEQENIAKQEGGGKGSHDQRPVRKKKGISLQVGIIGGRLDKGSQEIVGLWGKMVYVVEASVFS